MKLFFIGLRYLCGEFHTHGYDNEYSEGMKR
jgi:hypothetical protein